MLWVCMKMVDSSYQEGRANDDVILRVCVGLVLIRTSVIVPRSQETQANAY
jgi:hypothetical protein